MEPNILKRLGHSCVFVLLAVATARSLLASEELILTQALAPPTDPSWACSAAEPELIWTSPTAVLRDLTAGFEAACEPALDLEGRVLYFSGRSNTEMGFRIWQLNLETGETSPLTAEDSNARRPIVLPQGDLAYLRGGDLFRLSTELGEEEQLTFTQGRLRSAAVLPDGRLLLLEGGPESGRLFTALPDGTWTTLWPGLESLPVRDFSIIDEERLLILGDASDLFLVSIADPYAPMEGIQVDIGGSVERIAHGVDRSALLVIRRGFDSGSMARELVSLHLNPEPRILGYAAADGQTVVEATPAEPARSAEDLPSIVKPEMETGYLIVLDVARTDDPDLSGLTRDEIAKLRLLELDGSGTGKLLLAVEPDLDGSVYLQAPADTPLALELIDDSGDVLARTRTPIWIRPNERRACLGCHVSPAYAPPNVRPQALAHEPHRVQTGRGGTP